MNSTSVLVQPTPISGAMRRLTVDEILSPTAPDGDWDGISLIDYNIRAERMGWLPSAPAAENQPAGRCQGCRPAGQEGSEGLCRRS